LGFGFRGSGIMGIPGFRRTEYVSRKRGRKVEDAKGAKTRQKKLPAKHAENAKKKETPEN
jgi:hypothetical protein